MNLRPYVYVVITATSFPWFPRGFVTITDGKHRKHYALRTFPTLLNVQTKRIKYIEHEMAMTGSTNGSLVNNTKTNVTGCLFWCC